MKKLILVAITILCSVQFISAQVFVGKEKININELPNVKYIQLVGYNTSLFGMKMEIAIDYGQKMKLFKSTAIRNGEGKPMKFNTMIAALNFMLANGWEFIDYKEALVGRKMKFVYLLKRKK